MIETAQFLGPLGGLLCLAWAMGAIAGYSFHAKIVLTLHQRLCDARVQALEMDRDELKERVQSLEQKLTRSR